MGSLHGPLLPSIVMKDFGFIILNTLSLMLKSIILTLEERKKSKKGQYRCSDHGAFKDSQSPTE
jgi:hypothetical protein